MTAAGCVRGNAFEAFVGVENLEVDLKGRTIDEPALDYLRKKFR